MPSPFATWLGGPTLLLEYAGLRILTDPTFDQPQTYAEPGTTTLVKTSGPALSPADLGQLDLVLLSHHAHKDNLDWEGLELLKTGIRTLSTELAASELRSQHPGVDVEGYAPWQRAIVGDVAVTAVPALHGPPGSEASTGPVIGFVLEAEGAPTVYVSGDNASLDVVASIAERFPETDVAVLFAGAARVPRIDAPLTLTAEAAVRAAGILGAQAVVVVHSADWEHFSEGLDDVGRAFAGFPAFVPTPRGVRVAIAGACADRP